MVLLLIFQAEQETFSRTKELCKGDKGHKGKSNNAVKIVNIGVTKQKSCEKPVTNIESILIPADITLFRDMTETFGGDTAVCIDVVTVYNDKLRQLVDGALIDKKSLILPHVALKTGGLKSKRFSPLNLNVDTYSIKNDLFEFRYTEKEGFRNRRSVKNHLLSWKITLKHPERLVTSFEVHEKEVYNA